MNNLIDLKFKKDIDEGGSEYNYIHLYYVLKGKVTVNLMNKQFYLDVYDIIVINPDENYKMYGKECVVARFRISFREFLKLTNNKRRHIVCNTAINKNDNFEKLRRLLDLLINSMYEKEFKELIFNRYAYELILFLVSKFTNNTFLDLNIDKRKLEIENYIDANYNIDISLDNISENFGVTPQYFSKYFKNSFGINFLKYLNKIRVQNSSYDLINTNSTILKIALDNGFPNITSFTKAFNEVYGMNASDYRLDGKRKKIEEQIIPYEEIKNYLIKNDNSFDKDMHIVNIYANNTAKLLKPYWFKICNLGGLSKIINSGVKEQINEIQRELGFEFARVELDLVKKNFEEYNFFEEEKVLDFLISQNLKLILVIDFRRFNEDHEFFGYLKKFLYHFINRYGLKNIKKWKFEIFYDSDFKGEKIRKYNEFYENIRSVLEVADIKDRIIGPGLILDEEGKNLERFIKNNKKINHITITIAPFSVEEEKGNVFVNRTTDSNYVLNQYILAQNICNKESRIKKIYVSSWRESLGNYNIIYDSSYRAASILKNVIKGYDLLNTLPIDKILDLSFENIIDNKMLSGLSGILTRKGVKKPAFYAYKFLKKLDKYLIYKDNYVLATNDESRYYQIICHNCKKLNYKFYSNEFKDNEKLKLNEIFEDNENKIIELNFNNLENGRYLLKYRSISEGDGSVLENLSNMNFEVEAFFGVDEIDYLKSISKPSIQGKIFNVENEKLSFQCELKPNEIKHLHLIFVH